MNKSFRYTNCALLSVSSFIISVLLIINPERFISACLILFGAALAICGVSAIAFYFKNKKEKSLLICGISEIVFGALIIALKGIIVSDFQKSDAFFGFVFILIGGLYAFRLIKNTREKGRVFTPYACVIICLALAFVVLLYPFAQWILWRFIALGIALQGVLYIYITFGSRAFMPSAK